MELKGLEQPLSDRIIGRFKGLTSVSALLTFDMCFSPDTLSDEVQESFCELTEAIQMALTMISPSIRSEPPVLVYWRNFGLTKNKSEAKELLEMIVTRPQVKTLRHLDFIEDVSLSEDPELFHQVHSWLK